MAESEPARWPGWLSRQEAADYLGLSYRSIIRLEDTGTINARRIGKSVRISKASLDELMDSLPTSKETRHKSAQWPIAVLGITQEEHKRRSR